MFGETSVICKWLLVELVSAGIIFAMN